MFHFFTFSEFPENETLENILEIIGIMDYDTIIIYYRENIQSKLKISHYAYSKCPKSSERYKLNHIDELIKENPLIKGYCISGIYNKISDTYIKINDYNFPFPQNTKGTSHPNYTSNQIIFKIVKMILLVILIIVNLMII